MDADVRDGAAARADERHGVSTKIDPKAVAFALVAEIEGILSLAKNSQNAQALTIGAKNLRRRLDGLRNESASSSRR